MNNKIQRTFRDRRLTGAEIAEDQEVRRWVQSEFPPASSTRAAAGSPSENLRRAIRECGKGADAIAADVGISAIVISRFLAGERDVHMSTADKIADSLGLKLAAR